MRLNQPINEKTYDWIDITQLVISILVFFLGILWLCMVPLAAFGQIALEYGSTSSGTAGTLVGFWLTALIMTLIALTSIVSTIQKITDHSGSRKSSRDGMVVASLVAFALVLGSAALASQAKTGAKTLLLAGLSVPGIVIPVYWLLRFGMRNQWGQNLKRDSGMLVFSVGVSTPLIILFELLAGVFILILFAVGLSNHPQIADLFRSLQNNPYLFQDDPARLLSEIRAFLSLPGVFGWLLLVIAGIMPLIEELFKTLGVWVLQLRSPNPDKSYLAGLLSGGGFALFEGLLSVSSAQTGSLEFMDWVGLIVGRFGGSLLHILTGGLIGLAVGRAWQQRKLGLLLVAYCVSWMMHAMWNALALLGGITPLLHGSQVQSVWPYIGMTLLFVGMLIFYIILTKRVHSSIAVTALTPGQEG